MTGQVGGIKYTRKHVVGMFLLLILLTCIVVPRSENPPHIPTQYEFREILVCGGRAFAIFEVSVGTNGMRKTSGHINSACYGPDIVEIYDYSLAMKQADHWHTIQPLRDLLSKRSELDTHRTYSFAFEVTSLIEFLPQEEYRIELINSFIPDGESSDSREYLFLYFTLSENDIRRLTGHHDETFQPQT